MKLRKSRSTRLSKVPKAVFRCILDYCEPPRIKRVSAHYKYDARFPVNYSWPEQLSYHNSVAGVKRNDYGVGLWWFRLESGDKTDDREADVGFKGLDWSQITCLVIRYHSDNSQVWGFEFYNSNN